MPPIPDQPLPGFKEIPELLARFGRPRSVSVGPQSEIDIWEQIDYRDEKRRRRSNSVESKSSSHQAMKNLGTLCECSSDILLDDEEEELLRIKIDEPRVRYDVEVVTKLIVYAGLPVLCIRPLILGIGWLTVDFLPIAFHAMGLS